MEKKQYSPQLCPNCKTGMDSFLLDNHSPFCPYLYLHDGNNCPKFTAINSNEKDIEIEVFPND